MRHCVFLGNQAGAIKDAGGEGQEQVELTEAARRKERGTAVGKQTVPDLKELFRQAAEIAQQVPETMQEAAFNRALELLVGGVPQREPAGAAQSRPSAGIASESKLQGQGSSGDLLQRIDSTRHPGVRSTTKVLDRSLMVLQIALQDHSVDGLTPVEIARILTDKFRVATTRQAVGMALKDASHLVDRVGEGRGYRYRIMGPGEEYLAHLERNDGYVGNDQPVAITKKRGGRKSRKARVRSGTSSQHARASKTADAGTAKKIQSKRTSSTAIGPKAAIVSLVEQGFFATPKSGPEVQEYLKKKRGFDLGTDQLRLAMLRLVRDGVLERDENNEGQYEYKKP